MGNWVDVQVKLGLKSAEEVKASRWKMLASSTEQELRASQTLSTINPKRKTGQKKAESKRVKQSRKKNRKR